MYVTALFKTYILMVKQDNEVNTKCYVHLIVYSYKIM